MIAGERQANLGSDSSSNQHLLSNQTNENSNRNDLISNDNSIIDKTMFGKSPHYSFLQQQQNQEQKLAKKKRLDLERKPSIFFRRSSPTKGTTKAKTRLFNLSRKSKKVKIIGDDTPQATRTISMPIVKFDDEADMPVEQKVVEEPDFYQHDNDYDNDYYQTRQNGDFYGIDTRKFRRYMKIVLKFAFSQIGLAGLVIAYVILGAVIIMKIENSYEKHTKERLEITRDEFYRDVRFASENIVNDYLRENFHEKYNQFRDEEIYCSYLRHRNTDNDDSHPSRPNGNSTTNGNSTDGKDSRHNQTRSLVATHTSAMPHAVTTDPIIPTTTHEIAKKTTDKIYKDCDSKNLWLIKIDERRFRFKISQLLKVFLNEKDKNEDKDKSSQFEEIWTYSSSLLYSATVITTIGYGNITPKSNAGKIFTMFYALIGIPLMFMCLTNTGDLLAELFISSYSRSIRFLNRHLCKRKLKMLYSSSNFIENKKEMLTDFEVEYDNPDDRHVPIVATIGVLSAYIFTGAVIFSYWEKWSYLDGAYFCFITFTTIGFGDFVPGKNTLSTDKSGKAALCTLYLLLGMIIMAMCFKLMQDEVVIKARWLGQRLGIVDRN